MADLIARGPQPQDQWRRTLPPEPVTLGRLAPASTWDVPWDKAVSARHATLAWQAGQLLIRRLPASRNPIFFQGQPRDEFTLAPGEKFVIGATTFHFEDSTFSRTVDLPPRPDPTARNLDQPKPDAELTCSRQELREVKFLDADERIEVLAALPEVIRRSPSDEDLELRVVEVLLRGIPRAEAAGVVQLQGLDTDGTVKVTVRTALAQGGGAVVLEPSRRLIRHAIVRVRQSVLYRWEVKSHRPEDPTIHGAFDWAICVPLPDEPSPGWGLYVAGRRGEPLPAPADAAGKDLLKTDLKFAELVADIFGSLREVRDLQRRHTQLTSILSRPVVAALAQQDIDKVLQPRETEVTVLFCDLRGSCLMSEEGKADLLGLWNRVSEALSIMTSAIVVEQDGVIGDFQGDAAMGFWGWPMPSPDQVERAARAALNIQRRFAQAARAPGHPPAGFACGIGIANGPAMAGKLATCDQFKVGVFGPVVNLASRLESMTKRFGVSILLDERCAGRLRRKTHEHWCRCRRLARVQPSGMRTVLTVSQLLPPAVEPGPMPERTRRDHEAAVDAFLAGRWSDAADLLRRLPPDGPGDVLRAFMHKHQHAPPAGWDGVIALDGK